MTTFISNSLRTWCLSLILFTLLSVPVTAQQGLSAETMIQLGRIGSPVVSPNGEIVLYTVTRFDLEDNSSGTHIYLKKTDGSHEVRLTSGNSPIWKPDGSKIGFMRGGQFWEVNIDGSDERQVSFFDRSIGNVQYSPNGKFISFTKNVKIDKTAIDLYPDLPKANVRLYDGLMYRHWDTFHDGTYRHLFYSEYKDGKLIGEAIDVMAGEPFDTPLKPFGGSSQITWSPDSKALVYTSKKLTGAEAAYSTNSNLYMYTLEDGSTKILTSDNLGYDFYPAFSPDGSRLAWLSMQTPMYEADKYRLMVMDMASGDVRELSAGFDQNVNSHSWSRDGNRIYFLSGTEATVQIYYYDFRTRRADPNIFRLTEGTHDITGFDQAIIADRQVLVASKMSMSSPVELYLVELSNGHITPFTNVNEASLSTVTMGNVESRWVPTTDGKQMKVWVIYPPDFDPNKSYPTLLYAQGGPQGTVSQFFSYRWNFQVMAANGYIVVAPNRRGLPSFGQDWNRQITGDWGGQAMQDLLSAIDSLSEEPFVDNKRLGAVGASFGGYSVFWLAGNHQNRFKTFISHAGVFHLESMYGETEEMFFVDFEMEGAYWQSPRPHSYDKFSPHLFADKWDTPILMIHGELDYRVPVGQSYQAFTLAQRKGIPSRLVLFPQENHWILSAQNSLLWHREFYGWLDKWLK